MPGQSRSRSAIVEAADSASAHLASHSTQVEQSRAVAQVEAAVVAAKRFPRSETKARDRIAATCAYPEVYEKAFYRYPRGTDPDTGKPNIVTGPSIHLLRTVARIWGNIDYGVAEIERHDMGGGRGESEMLSQAWDMEDNVRSSTVYRVPWVRVTRAGGIQYLGDDPRNVYENNANQGARRTRAMLEAVIPPEIVALAVRICREAGEASVKARPLPEQRQGAVKAFAELGVTQRQIEDKVGKPADEWLAPDLIFLKTIRDSLVERTTTVGEEFGAGPSRKRAGLDEQPDRAAEDSGEPVDTPEEAAARQALPEGGRAERSRGVTDAPDEFATPQTPPAADTVATPDGDVMTAETSAAVSAWFERYGLTGPSNAKTQRRLRIMREVMGMPNLSGLDSIGERLGADLVRRLNGLTPEQLDRFGIGGGQ